LAKISFNALSPPFDYEIGGIWRGDTGRGGRGRVCMEGIGWVAD